MENTCVNIYKCVWGCIQHTVIPQYVQDREKLLPGVCFGHLATGGGTHGEHWKQPYTSNTKHEKKVDVGYKLKTIYIIHLLVYSKKGKSSARCLHISATYLHHILLHFYRF